MSEQQRYLTGLEIADLMARHPIVAARVAATKAFLLTGTFDQLAPTWGEISIDVGLLPQQGIAFQDSKYGMVVIFPAPNGKIYFNGFVKNTTVEVINSPEYSSPNTDPNSPECDWLCKLGKGVDTATFIVGALLAVTVINAFRKSR